MKLLWEHRTGSAELAALLADHFTVDGARPVVTFDQAGPRSTCVTVDFPVQCEPRSQTAFQISLAEALSVCQPGRNANPEAN